MAYSLTRSAGSLSVIASALILSTNVKAADNKITNIKVDGDIVRFSTSQAKVHTLPNCVAANNAQQWTLSLTSAAGKASYTLLVAAMTDNRSVVVTSANDCADSTGYERAQSIEVGNASQQSGAGSSKLMTLYQGDGVTKVGTIYSIVNQHQNTGFHLLRNEGDKWLDYVSPYHNMQAVWVYYTNTDCTGDVAFDEVGRGKLNYNENFNNGHFFSVTTARSARYVKSYHNTTDSQCHSMSEQWKKTIVYQPDRVDRICGVAPCQIRTQ
jgi:hypothetical protein